MSRNRRCWTSPDASGVWVRRLDNEKEFKPEDKMYSVILLPVFSLFQFSRGLAQNDSFVQFFLCESFHRLLDVSLKQ